MNRDEMKMRKTRVLLAKPQFDCHDAGAKVLAVVLRDAGFEVIYTGLHQSVESIARAAIQEDSDLIGISILTDPPVPILEDLKRCLRENGSEDIPILVGGIVNPADKKVLKEKLGVAEVFGPGTPFDTIIQKIRRISSGKE